MANSTATDVGHIAKFDGSNSPSWKYGVWMLLEKNRLISIVDGSKRLPEQVNRFFRILIDDSLLYMKMLLL